MKLMRIILLTVMILICATCKRITRNIKDEIEELSPLVDKIVVRNFSSSFIICHNIDEKEKIQNLLDIIKNSEAREQKISTLMPGYTLSFLDKEERILAKLDTLSFTIDDKDYELNFTEEKYDEFINLLHCE